jgi:dephospho-CoA kinase
MIKPWKGKFILGVTGSIASGKSTACKFLESLGGIIVSADSIAHSFLERDSPVLEELILAFGNEILDSEGKVDRKKLGAKVFEDKSLLDKLNSIMHPRIRQKTLDIFDSIQKGIIIWEAPLLFEAKGETLCHAILCVYTEESEQISRLKKRDNLSEEESKNRIQSQWNIKDKLKRSDFIIENNLDLNSLEQKCSDIIQKIRMNELNP